MINKAVGLLNFKQRVMQSSRNRTDHNACFVSDFSSIKINTDLLRLLSLGCFNKGTENFPRGATRCVVVLLQKIDFILLYNGLIILQHVSNISAIQYIHIKK